MCWCIQFFSTNTVCIGNWTKRGGFLICAQRTFLFLLLWCPKRYRVLFFRHQYFTKVSVFGVTENMTVERYFLHNTVQNQNIFVLSVTLNMLYVIYVWVCVIYNLKWIFLDNLFNCLTVFLEAVNSAGTWPFSFCQLFSSVPPVFKQGECSSHHLCVEDV